MAALPNLMTVARFLELPEGGEFAYELHHGEVVAVTRPKSRHAKLQLHFVQLLTARLGDFGVATMEWAYRPVPEFELRVADVASTSRERWDTVDPDDVLHGAPELVIEIKSPSNTKRQLQELVSLCLAGGSYECWIVDAAARSVSVARRDGSVSVYGPGDDIPLQAFGGNALSAGDLF